MSTSLTIMYEGHRKVVRVGANDNMSTVMQVCEVREAKTSYCFQCTIFCENCRNPHTPLLPGGFRIHNSAVEQYHLYLKQYVRLNMSIL